MSLLGYQVLCSLPDIDLDAGLVRIACTQYGFDPDVFVTAPQPTDDFRAACASLRQRLGKGHGRVQILSDEVENGPERVSYQVTRVVWNLAERMVVHEKGLLIEFSKATGEITSRKLDKFDPNLAQLVKCVQDRIEAAANTVRGRKFRHAVRDQILALGGQRLLPDTGVYFVPADWDGLTLGSLVKVESLVSSLYGERGRFYILPVRDEVVERDALSIVIGANLAEAMDRVAARAMQRVSEGTERAVRADLLANLYGERAAVLADVLRLHAGGLTPELGGAVERANEALRQLEEVAAIA